MGTGTVAVTDHCAALQSNHRYEIQVISHCILKKEQMLIASILDATVDGLNSNLPRLFGFEAFILPSPFRVTCPIFFEIDFATAL
jgi:hypothetical protein